MAFSTGTRGLIGEAIAWFGAAGVVAFGVIHLDEVKRITASVLGIDPTQMANVQSVDDKPRRDAVRAAGTVELRAERNGHFHAEAEINGRSVGVMVDTGATLVALSYEDAEHAGIFLKPQDFTQSVGTANGRARVAPVTLDRVSIGDITVRNVRAVVSEPGRLGTSLLGMSFLGRLKVEMKDGTLLLAE